MSADGSGEEGVGLLVWRKRAASFQRDPLRITPELARPSLFDIARPIEILSIVLY